LDDTTFTTLRKMNLTNIELVTLNKIEDEKLLDETRKNLNEINMYKLWEKIIDFLNNFHPNS